MLSDTVVWWRVLVDDVKGACRFIIATLAAIVASQALISAVFQIVYQAITQASPVSSLSLLHCCQLGDQGPAKHALLRPPPIVLPSLASFEPMHVLKAPHLTSIRLKYKISLLI